MYAAIKTVCYLHTTHFVCSLYFGLNYCLLLFKLKKLTVWELKHLKIIQPSLVYILNEIEDHELKSLQLIIKCDLQTSM